MPKGKIKLEKGYVKLDLRYARDFRVAVYTARFYPLKIRIDPTRVLVAEEIIISLEGKIPLMMLPPNFKTYSLSQKRDMIYECFLDPNFKFFTVTDRGVVLNPVLNF